MLGKVKCKVIRAWPGQPIGAIIYPTAIDRERLIYEGFIEPLPEPTKQRRKKVKH